MKFVLGNPFRLKFPRGFFNIFEIYFFGNIALRGHFRSISLRNVRQFSGFKINYLFDSADWACPFCFYFGVEYFKPFYCFGGGSGQIGFITVVLFPVYIAILFLAKKIFLGCFRYFRHLKL